MSRIHLAPAPASTVTRGVLLMILAILLFTAMDATAKGLIERYPAPQVVWSRFAGQLLIVLVILNRHAPRLMRTQHPWLHLARSAFQLGATGLFFLSLPHVGLAEATALTDINPVLITLGAALFLGERLGPRRIAGVWRSVDRRADHPPARARRVQPLGAVAAGVRRLSYTGNALLTRHLGARESRSGLRCCYASIFGTVVSALALPFVWVPVATGGPAGCSSCRLVLAPGRSCASSAAFR